MSSNNNSTATAASTGPTSLPYNSTSPTATLSSNSTANSTHSANTLTPIADSTPSSAAPIKATASADPDALAKEVEACHREDSKHDTDSKYIPFCKPKDGQNVTVGDEYPCSYFSCLMLKKLDTDSSNSHLGSSCLPTQLHEQDRAILHELV